MLTINLKYFWSYVHTHGEHDRAMFNDFDVDDRN